MSTTFSQQILSSKLLLAVISKQKSNFNDKFKIEPIIASHLGFDVKMFE